MKLIYPNPLPYTLTELEKSDPELHSAFQAMIADLATGLIKHKYYGDFNLGLEKFMENLERAFESGWIRLLIKEDGPEIGFEFFDPFSGEYTMLPHPDILQQIWGELDE